MALPLILNSCENCSLSLIVNSSKIGIGESLRSRSHFWKVFLLDVMD